MIVGAGVGYGLAAGIDAIEGWFELIDILTLGVRFYQSFKYTF